LANSRLGGNAGFRFQGGPDGAGGGTGLHYQLSKRAPEKVPPAAAAAALPALKPPPPEAASAVAPLAGAAPVLKVRIFLKFNASKRYLV